MSEHQIHFGRKFYLDNKTGYWISTDYSKEKPRIRAHQWVWINVNFKIPKGYHIHHINGDKSDNRIENLDIMKRSRHLSYHMVKHMLDPEKKKMQQEQCERIRPLTKDWHKSKEGISWHRYHAIKTGFGKSEPIDYICTQCQAGFKSSKLSNTRFCTNACKSKWRRDNKLDDVDKTCPVCQSLYRSSKYSRSQTCSRICGQRMKKNG